MNVWSKEFCQVRKLLAKGFSPAKAVGKVFGLKGNQAGEAGKAIEFLDAVSVHFNAADIQAVYDNPQDYGKSCTTIGGRYYSPYVGEFYARVGIACVTIPSARALVNPRKKEFFKTYGENHFLLESLLKLGGYKCTHTWADNLPRNSVVTTELVTKKREVVAAVQISENTVFISMKTVFFNERELVEHRPYLDGDWGGEPQEDEPTYPTEWDELDDKLRILRR